MKNITLKIFLIVLLCGLIGITGQIILTYEIGRLSEGYEVIVDEYFKNLNENNEIRVLMYTHQAVIVKHTAADTEDKYNEYEWQAEQIEQELRERFNELGERMQGGEHEQVYHRAYTNFHTYLQNADVALEFSRAGSKNTADFYIVNILDVCTRKVNSCIEDMNGYLTEETEQAQEKMNGYISFSRVASVVSIIVIAASMAMCLYFCVRITVSLDQYKNELERDVQNKTAALVKHNERILNLQNSTIIGLANLIENRDGETGGHVKRTAKYVSMLARAARSADYKADILTDEYIELLERAAPLHDIGKIAVSDTILKKPGKLTDEEFEMMKQHASIGGKMIRDVIGGIENEEYVRIAEDIAAYHHEGWDGTGHCSGLSGEDIPLSARIMALADVFNALVSPRCYKKAFSLSEAFGIIEGSAGTHFDPKLTELFLALRPEIEQYLENG